MYLFALLACVPTPPATTDPASPTPDPTPVSTADTGAPACTPADPAEEGVAVTSNAAWRGAAIDGGWSWRGIAYAAPPTGPLRWMPPEAPPCETEVQDATQPGAACPQWDADRTAVVGDEDCLTLDVFAPEDAVGRPVLVFIHGGANQQGSTTQERLGAPLYDGGLLAQRTDSVVVTIQYRLGALGFLAHPDLDDGTGGTGNHGLRDQIQALQWVRDEIASFGGDPERVLVFGESAGARNTCSLVASPLAAGLFDAALMQSGSCRQSSRSEREAEGAAWVAAGPCADAAEVASCLTGLPASAVIEATPPDPITDIGLVQESFGPTVDGVVLPLDPMEALETGAHNHVPLVFGANAEETGLWLVAPIPDGQYQAAVLGAVGSTFGLQAAQQVLDLYPLEAFDSAQDALIAVTTDAQFVCPSRRMARAAAASQSEPVYRYFFDHRMSGLLGLPGAAHGLELLYVFQRMDAISYNARPADYAMEALLADHWSTLAATGAPSAPWTAYDPVTDGTMVLSDDPGMQDGIRTARCDLWDTLAGG